MAADDFFARWARPKATGMPDSRNKNRPANISGTKFWARNEASIYLSPASFFAASAASSSARSSSSLLPPSMLIGSSRSPRRKAMQSPRDW